MKKLHLISLFTILIIFSCKENTTNPEYGKIKGKVIDKFTSKPISDVFIKTHPATASLLTDQNGNFTIENLGNQTYSVMAEKNGYGPNNVDVGVVLGKETICIIPLSMDGDTVNHAPNYPSNPTPGNGANIELKSTTLYWMCSDPDGDVLTYEIFFGTDASKLTSLKSDIKTPGFVVTNLSDSIKYYWYVIAKDPEGLTATSEIWSFTVNNSSSSNNTNLPNDYYIYMPFDGNYSEISSNHYQTSGYGVAYITDRKGSQGKAINFYGQSRVFIDNSEAANYGNSDISTTFWLKPNSTGMVPSFGSHIGLVHDVGRFYFGITYLNELEVWSTSSNFVGCKPKLPDNQWSHVAFVFRRTTNYCKIYINGYVAAEGFLPDFQYSSPNKLEIGGRTNCGDQYSGGMDDLRLYKRALTDTEVYNLSR